MPNAAKRRSALSRAPVPVVDIDVALEVACHEAVIRQAYKDSVGRWTWSVGLTSATGHNVERYIGNPASLQHCLNVFVWALRNYARQVDAAFAGVKLTTAQYAGAVSFHWNTGAIGRASWVKHFRAGDMAAARKAIMNWTTPPEVTGRRQKERALIFDGVWSNDGTMTEFIRLTARSTPDWSSAKKIDVRRELAAAFGAAADVVIDSAPRPDAPVPVPTLSPDSMFPFLARGSTNRAMVRLAQQLLNHHGADPRLQEDGVFGQKTADAVRAFQRARGLTVDGAIGPETWPALRDLDGDGQPDDAPKAEPDPPFALPPDPVLVNPVNAEPLSSQAGCRGVLRNLFAALRGK